MGIANYFWLDNVNLYEEYGVRIGTVDKSFFKTEDLVPSVESVVEKISGADGLIFYGMNLKERPITIPCFVDGITESEKIRLQQILFCPKPRKLIFDSEPYKYLNVVSDGKTEFKYLQYNDGLYRGFFECNYIAHDPLYYSYYTSLDNYEDYDVHSIYSNTDISIHEVPSAEITNITGSKTFRLFNHGNYKAKMKITCTGSATTLVITNITNNQSCTLKNLAGETIIVNGYKGRVTNATDTILKTSKHEGDFITLESGYNDISISGSDLNLSSVSFLYRHTYL